MIDNDWRNARIEEAAKAIFYADPPSNPHGPSSDLVFGEPYTHSATKTARKHARAALAVFEKAYTPTDDERGDRSRLITIINEIQSHDPFVIADAVLAAGFGFRRTDVPEPSAECPQPCMHLSQEDAREGRTCAEHPCTCREPQGEPSDVDPRFASLHLWERPDAIEAARLAYQEGYDANYDFDDCIAFALRAAGAVR